MAVQTWVVRVDFPSGRKSYRLEAASPDEARAKMAQHLNECGLPPTGIVEVEPV